MHQEPDVGFDPGSPGSRPGPKEGAKLLRHPGIPDKLILNTEILFYLEPVLGKIACLSSCEEYTEVFFLELCLKEAF